ARSSDARCHRPARRRLPRRAPRGSAAATYHPLRHAAARIALDAVITGPEERARGVGGARERAHAALLVDAHAFGTTVVLLAAQRAKAARPVAVRPEAAVVALGRIETARTKLARDV